jgi:hypothetical protein
VPKIRQPLADFPILYALQPRVRDSTICHLVQYSFISLPEMASHWNGLGIMFVASIRTRSKPEAFAVLILGLFSISLVYGQQDDLPLTQVDRPDFKQIEAELNKSNSDEIRLSALQTLQNASKFPDALELLDTVKEGLKDPNDEIRYQCLSTMSFICKDHNIECPVEFLKMIDDAGAKIQENYQHLIYLFSTFPPEGLDVAMQLYERSEGIHKSNFLALIGKAGGKNKRAMKILFDAVNSNEASARGNGTVGLWHATKDFEIVLPLYFDRIQDIELVRAGKGKFSDKNARALIGLNEISMAHLFHQHLNQRRSEFMAHLENFATHRDSELRQRCISYIAACLSATIEEINPNEQNQDFSKWVNEDLANLDTIGELAHKLENDSNPKIALRAKHIGAMCRQIEQKK